MLSSKLFQMTQPRIGLDKLELQYVPDIFFSLMEVSKEWKIQKIWAKYSTWTALTQIAATGHIGTFMFWGEAQRSFGGARIQFRNKERC